METTTARMPIQVKTHEGNLIDAKKYQQSLRTDYKHFCQSDMADDGTPYLRNCMQALDKTGNKITGNGTCQFPLTIELDAVHKAAPEILEALITLHDAYLNAVKDNVDGDKAYTKAFSVIKKLELDIPNKQGLA